MGMDIQICLEARIQGVWTYLTFFSMKRDYALFDQLGYVEGQEPSKVAPDEWTPVSRWLFWQYGGWCPTSMSLDQFRKVCEQRFLESPEQFDPRPGWIPPFQEWLEKTVPDDPKGWTISWFLGQWPHRPPDDLGTDVRLCIWFT